jgi:hypothetical protein
MVLENPLAEIWRLLAAMAPFLLLGFPVAELLQVLFLSPLPFRVQEIRFRSALPFRVRDIPFPRKVPALRFPRLFIMIVYI